MPAVVVRTVAELRGILAPDRRAGRPIGLVPTMGALHDGHLELIREAAAVSEEVVVSVFVNPTQFNDPGDLDAYPRDLDADVALASDAGATIVFAPTAAEVYPNGFSTSIHVSGVTERWEGASRGASHFDGVATVVAKLFTIVGADAAWFGQKDAQQVAVVRRLVADLDIPIVVHAVPTVRDASGLALSSRNVRLTDGERAQALALSRSLIGARSAVDAGERDASALAGAALEVLASAGIAPEYWAIVDPATFEPLPVIDRDALAIVAAFVGDVRLIDNLPLPLPR